MELIGVYEQAEGLIRSQQEKSFLRTATKPVLVVDKLRNPNPAPHDAVQASHPETPLERNRRMRKQYGSPVPFKLDF